MTRDDLLYLIDKAANESWQLLDLSGREIIELPPEIGQLEQLKTLILGKREKRRCNFVGNQLKTLPPEIGQLQQLRTLLSEGNQLETLPAEIGRLHRLRILMLGENQLSDLPLEIEQLKNLQVLILDENRFTSIPAKVGQLQRLKTLSFCNNALGSIFSDIEHLTKLKSLVLSGNRLSDLPLGIGQLASLQTLDLSSNKLSSLPLEIVKLINLNELDLTSNQLSSLPSEITEQLVKLKKLDLRDNPIFRSIESQNFNKIHKYSRNILELLNSSPKSSEPERITPNYEAKLLIIGEGGAGKTSLAKKLINSDYVIQPEERSTEGIDVRRWDFDLPNNQTFHTNVWDFGGQEIYHATHQIFLTKRSLYVIVVDTRQDNTDLYYWLNIVELLGDSSPVIIIKNEKQDRSCQVNERQLRGEFNNLKETFTTNLKTNRGLADIREKLQKYITTLPHIGQPLPRKWIYVRQALESDPRNYISFDEYSRICKANDIQHREEQLQLSDYLHDLGVCFHFQDDPLLKKTLILKPEWGTTAVYKALDKAEVRENLGRFNRAQLDEIWSDGEYIERRDELLQLMKRFQLCYEIPGTGNEFIAPQLLDFEQPDYDWNEANNLLLRYKYDFMPKGIITRFIVEMSRFIEGQRLVWKSGVVLNNGAARAEVIELYHKGEIQIRVSGNRCRDLLTVISHELDKINTTFGRLSDKCRKLIPCSCRVCIASQKPHFYQLDVLNRFIAAENYQIQCQNSFDLVDIRSLLITDALDVHWNEALESWTTQIEYREYLLNEQIKEQGTSFSSEARIIILGEPGVGKTTLFKKILDPNYIVPNSEDPTLGINIHGDWKILMPNSQLQKVKCSIWDFGGHEIQSYIHHIFLAKRALYVLVVDDRKQNTEFDYWFNIISSLGEEASILVVLNERNYKSISSFDLVYYREKFSNLKIESRSIDFSTNDGRLMCLVEKIKDMIMSLDHVHRKIPRKWALIKHELEKIRKNGKNHITYSEYKSTCRKFDVAKEDEQLALSQYLHDLGVVLHFQNDLNLLDFLILSPQWVTEAIYERLNSYFREVAKFQMSRVVSWNEARGQPTYANAF